MNNKNFENTSEENFLKNKAKRKKTVESLRSKKKVAGSVEKTVKNKATTEKPEKKVNNSGGGKFSTKKVLKIVAIILAALVASILAAALGFLIYTVTLDDTLDNKNSIIAGDTNADNRASSSANKDNSTEQTIDIGDYKYYTFLATATDLSGNLTDVIMVARFHYPDDPEFTSPEVSVLQIPRDTYVRISSKLYLNDDGTLSEENFNPKSGTYATKINTVFSHGRKLANEHVTSLLKETEGKTDKEIEAICASKNYKFLNADIEKIKKYHKAKESEKKEIKANIARDFGISYLATLIYHYFGIPIDYQAQVNIAGFRGIVDAIGGVDLEVPRRMYYKDPYQDLYIDLYPGYQHLNGKKAEEFVRFRRYLRGDVDRLDAQKIFITAFLDKLLSPGTVTKIDNIIVEIQNNLYTGISFNDMVRFSKKILKMDLANDIAMHTLPGVGEYVGNVSYFIAYKDESIALINDQFNVYDKDIEASKFHMIDFNDVVSKKKPEIGQSTISVDNSSSTKKEETTTETTAGETAKPDNTSDVSEPPAGDNQTTNTRQPVTVPENDNVNVNSKPETSEDTSAEETVESEIAQEDVSEAEPETPDEPINSPEEDFAIPEEVITPEEPTVVPEEPEITEQVTEEPVYIEIPSVDAETSYTEAPEGM